MPTVDNLTISLTGSQEPDNFNIEIFQWDVTDTVANNPKLRTTWATNVTRTTASPAGGTLAAGNYLITGVTGTDYHLKMTATNKCGSSAFLSLREPNIALRVYAQAPLLQSYPSGSPAGTVFGSGNPAYTTSDSWSIATFDGLFYLADDAPSYDSVGNGTTFTTNFTFTHLGTYSFGGTLQTGKWANGLLNIGTMTLSQSNSTPYKAYTVIANQTANIQSDGSANTYYSTYRITNNLSNTSRTFDFYFAGASV